MTAFDRSREPAAGAIRAFDFPDVERRDAGGLDVRVARMARLPVVSVNLFVRAGESALAEDVAGLAVLAGDALEGGTRRRSGTELAESLERLGARLGVSTGWEGTSVTLSCLAERMAEGLAILAETVLSPGFPDEEVQRAREQALAGIRQAAMDPASVATKEASRRVFAAGVPYARPLGGFIETVEPLRRGHLEGFVDAFYRPGTGGLVAVGDLSTDEVAAMVREHFGDWTGAPPQGPAFEVEARSTQRQVVVVDRPGSVQSEIRVGHVGLQRNHPDEFPVVVLNTVLGGAFTSRLNLNLRERNGFTYGVRSRFSLRRQPGSFDVSTSVGTDVTSPAVREILNELEGIVARGPTTEEVEAARDYIAGVFPLRVETAGQVAGRITELLVYGLEDDYHDHYRARVRGVTVEQAGQAARRHVRPEEAQVVVVGDADAVVADLEALDIGPVEVVASR
jgi:zinc protease